MTRTSSPRAFMTSVASSIRIVALDAIELRWQVRPGDVQSVREIAQSTEFFAPAEVDIAVELIEDRLVRGQSSEYHFLFADRAGRPIGFASFGEIAGTESSYDLYWVAVHGDEQRGGIGRRLLNEIESRIAQRGGRRIYVETSSRPLYEPTRQFYLRCDYRVEAVLEDFYAPGDGKIILVKSLG